MADLELTMCRDKASGCTNTIESDKVTQWNFCEISQRYRCWPCTHALAAAGRMAGTDQETPDNLPRDSRGALPKETASTITPHAVRG